eukprot:m51a1_g8751 putative minor histocompatibility antigen h13 isoform x2 (352) ;mRNA; f:90502-92045
MAAEDSASLFVSYAALIAQASACVVVGSRRSLRSAASGDTQLITRSEAARFPVVASCALVALFLAVKYLEPQWISALLSLYFLAIGSLCLGGLLRPAVLLAHRAPRPFRLAVPLVHRLPFVGGEPITIEFDTADVVSTALGSVIPAVWATTRHWAANNVIGVALAVEAISFIGLPSYGVAAILLCGLFVYDVWWVFGTNVMVDVVRGFDAPIKIMWPRTGGLGLGALLAHEGQKFSMLGLGDIAIPGFLVALLLKFDASRPGRSRANFAFGVVAYVAGLVNTVAVMHVYKHAQPALLYLVPWGLLLSLLVAAVRGELHELLKFKIEEEPKTPAAGPTPASATAAADSKKNE